MIHSVAAASRILRRAPKALQKCQTVDICIFGLAYVPVRPYSISSTPFRRKRTWPSSAPGTCHIVLPSQWMACGQFRTAKSAAWGKLIRRFEDLPHNYKDEIGLPFRAKPLSRHEAVTVFGPRMDVRIANNALRIIHGRRVAGTLFDPSLPFAYDDQVKLIALAWLREHLPVDEAAAEGQRAEIELKTMDPEILADNERLLYTPNSGNHTADGKGENSVYGESGLDAIREAAKQRKERENAIAQAQKGQPGETREITGPLVALQRWASRQELRNQEMKTELGKPRAQHPKLKYYLERAKTAPDEVPEMSVWQRLWPSGLITLLVVGVSIGWAQFYVPPAAEYRLWPDLPPAAATMIALILINAAVWALWHHPPAFRILQKYFIVYPGYPRGLAVLGSMFSHQQFSHLGVNMAMLWFVGTRLHDEVGRANFLALYFSVGALSAFSSLAIYAARRLFITSTLGASGAVYGVVAAFLWMHRWENYKILGLPPDPLRGITGLGILVPMILVDVWGLTKVGKAGTKNDHYAHLGGMMAGILGAGMLQKRAAERKRLELDRRKSLGQRAGSISTKK